MKPTGDQDEILQVLYANFGCFALLTAHTLQIFELLESEPLAIAAANKLSIQNRPMELLLTTLAAHRFLSKTEDRFLLGPLARDYLVEGSPTYLGGS